jgi:hypothetical protein
MATYQEAVNAQPAAAKKFGRLGEVMGVAIIRWEGGGFGLKVNLREQPAKKPRPDQLVIHGVPATIDVVGDIEAYGSHAS